MPIVRTAAAFDPMRTLYNELHNDPLGWGYAGMTNAQRYAKLTDTTTGRTLPRSDVMPSEIRKAIRWNDIPNGSQAANVKQRDVLGWFLTSPDPVDMGDATERNLLLNCFPDPSTSRTEILKLATRTVSRAEELGIGYLDEGMVERAWTGNW